MSNSTSESSKFEKLRGRENYQVWSRQAKSYLIIKGLWSSVSTELISSATQAQKDSDAKALAEITLLLEPYNFGHIAECTTSKSAWDNLQGAYESGGLTRKVELLKNLVQMKLRDFETMSEYVNTFTMTSFECKSAGLKLNDEIVASLLLAGLPEECDALVLAIENQKETLTVDSVKNTLLQDKKFDKEEGGGALFSKSSNKNRFKCHICSKPGHSRKTVFPRKTRTKKIERQNTMTKKSNCCCTLH